MKQTKVFKAWRALDNEAGCYWKPDQADVWIALVSGVCIGLFLGVSV